MEAYVYITTNLVNGKKYIGYHKSTQFDEWYKGSGTLLWKAINKYGWDNFSTEIVKEFDSCEEALLYESELISELDAISSKEYYNLYPGGYGGGLAGRIIVHKGDIQTAINPEDVPFYKSLGFSEGGTVRGTKGWIRVTNGEIETMIPPEELEEFESIGFYRGGKSRKSAPIRVTDGVVEKCLYENEVDRFLLEHPTFRIGGLPRTAGTVRITNGVLEKLVNPDEVDRFLDDGWWRGCRNQHLKGRIWIHKPGVGKRQVFPEEYNDELKNNGWLPGEGTEAHNCGKICVNDGEHNKYTS